MQHLFRWCKDSQIIDQPRHLTYLLCSFAASLSHTYTMEIKEKMVAVITYTLKDDSGEVIQKATEETPFAFIHGVGQVLPAFDANLKGKRLGDAYEFNLLAGEAYGEYDPEQVQALDKAVFAGAPDEMMRVGETIPMQYDGHHVYGVITEINPETVTLDFNHPLAGKNLNFSGIVLEVREATAEEMAHGHVHGRGGHHH